MSIKIKRIGRFDGGLNESSSPKKITSNQLADAQDVAFRRHGRIGMMGRSKKYETFPSLIDSVSDGYGLHKHNVGISLSDPADGTVVSNSTITQGSGGSHAMGSYSLWGTEWSLTSAVMHQLNAPHTFTFQIDSGDTAAGSFQTGTTQTTLASGQIQYSPDPIGMYHAWENGANPFIQFLTLFQTA